MKRKIRRMRIFQRVLNLIISVAVLGIMVNTYVTFANNRTVQSGGQTIPIYPVDPITWPTWMMIATGAVSILFNTTIMTAYCWGVSTANRVNQYAGYWGYLMHVVNIGVWLATSTTFQMLQGDPSGDPPPRDLYGWTCSDAVDQLVSEVEVTVNFNLQCVTQVCPRIYLPYIIYRLWCFLLIRAIDSQLRHRNRQRRPGDFRNIHQSLRPEEDDSQEKDGTNATTPRFRHANRSMS
jgi:hypothetical protein